MATMVGKEKDLARLLKDLIELDYDAIEAYRAAIERVDDSADKSQLRRFLEDHERHVSELTLVVRGMGEEVPKGADIKGVLTKGKVLIGGLLGDRAVLVAMKTNEDDTNTAYERAASRNDLPLHLREIIERNLNDERRHRAWLEVRLDKTQTIAAR